MGSDVVQAAALSEDPFIALVNAFTARTTEVKNMLMSREGISPPQPSSISSGPQRDLFANDMLSLQVTSPLKKSLNGVESHRLFGRENGFHACFLKAGGVGD